MAAGELLDCPGAQAASTVAPPSHTCARALSVCAEIRVGTAMGQGRSTEEAGGVRLRPAAEGGNRPLPGAQTFQRLWLPWTRLRRVPGRGQVASSEGTCRHPPLSHTYDDGHSCIAVSTRPRLPDLWARLCSWRCWSQAGSQPQGRLPPSSARHAWDEGWSAKSLGSWRLRLGTWS